MTPKASAWATVELKLCPSSDPSRSSSSPVDTQPSGAELIALESLAYLLAELEEVGGVEQREGSASRFAPLCEAEAAPAEPSTDESATPSGFANIHDWLGESRGLVVYTSPESVEEVLARAQALAHNLDLKLESRHQVHHDDAWRDHWKSFYRPMIVGQKQLLIRPSWIEASAEDPALQLVLDPGRAFGTGLHESTRLCLDHLAELARDTPNAPPKSVLDLGCGSGILALAALRFWGDTLEDLYFADLDPEAVATARENWELNHGPQEPTKARCHFVTGTAQTFQAQSSNPGQAPRFELVIANIRPEVLIPDAPRIASLLAPGATLLLSGILQEEAETVAQAYRDQGLEPGATPTLRDWSALCFRAPMS